jgi:uncharacterized protein (TIGR03083 family)
MIAVNHLFPQLHVRLVELLRVAKPDDWNKPTVCPGWSVKDVATHILDGNLRRLSIARDGYFSPRIPAPKDGELLGYLNELNRTWVEAAARLSPKILIELIERYGAEYVDYMTSLDPMAKATFAVDWAGETESLNWMDVARDYTEQWLHQEQIREAMKKESLCTEEFYKPVLDIWMLALPHAYGTMDRPNGTSLEVTVTGKVGGTWYLVKLNDKWELWDAWELPPTAKVKVGMRDAWKVLGKNYRGEQARTALKISGDEDLANHFADVAAVMA